MKSFTTFGVLALLSSLAAAQNTVTSTVTVTMSCASSCSASSTITSSATVVPLPAATKTYTFVAPVAGVASPSGYMAASPVKIFAATGTGASAGFPVSSATGAAAPPYPYVVPVIPSPVKPILSTGAPVAPPSTFATGAYTVPPSGTRLAAPTFSTGAGNKLAGGFGGAVALAAAAFLL